MHIRWHRRPAVRVAAVGVLLVALSLAAVVVTAMRVRNALLLAGGGVFALALAGGLIAARRMERLRAANHRLSAVTQSAHDAIVSTDEGGNITFWNRGAEATFGYSESEVLGKPVTLLIDEPNRSAYAAALPAPAAGDLALGHVIEVTGLRKDGGKFSSEFSLAALRGSDGTTFTAVIRDVTERKQSQEGRRRRDEQVRQVQKMEALGRLAGGVAHDINNVLMAVHGYAEMLVQSLGEGDRRRSDAEEIVKAADRAADLARQLLVFSQPQVTTRQAIALDRLVDGMRSELQRLTGPEIHIATEFWPDLTPVLADSTQIEQVFVTLVTNARDAMPGGGTIAVELRNIELDSVGVAAHPGLHAGRYVEIAISDTGPGMEAETSARVFEPFFTRNESRDTGLGLATVYGIVQQSNGTIEVQSRVGHGTTFYVYLPSAVNLGKPAPIEPAPLTSGPETILLVDDDDRMRALVANMLRKNGYTVLLSSAGDQAMEIAALHRGRIHLLLTDVVMPGLSGRILSERLTALRPDTRVLYMSGYSEDAILRYGVKKAVAYFIQKPFSIDALANKIRETLAAPANIPMS